MTTDNDDIAVKLADALFDIGERRDPKLGPVCRIVFMQGKTNKELMGCGMNKEALALFLKTELNEITMIVPTVCYNPVILLVKNVSADRWHPIVFWECPPPSSALGEELRWKSKGHHTAGFGTKEEAEKSALELCGNQYQLKTGGEVYFDFDHWLDWDGKDNPTSVTSFNLNSLIKFEPNKQKELKPNQYRCSSCKGVFEKGWSEEEAKENGFEKEECDLLCDDCYNTIMNRMTPY